ncbi:MAG: VWA domain-containing protein [Bradymonadales bacterium]
MFFIQHWNEPLAAKFSIFTVLLIFAYAYYRLWKWQRAAAVATLLREEKHGRHKHFYRLQLFLGVLLALSISLLIFFAPLGRPLLFLLFALGGASVCAWTYVKLFKLLSAKLGLCEPKIVARLRSQSLGKLRGLRRIRFLLLLISLILLNIVLMQPQGAEKATKLRREGFEAVFLLDLSRSMMAQDLAPSRLHAAKSELLRILKYMQNDKVGLVLFASQPFVQAPLTSDASALESYIKQANPDMMPDGGTDLAAALWMAFELLEGRPLSAKDLKDVKLPKHSRLILILSDGESHGQALAPLIEAAKSLGLRIDSIGFGSKSGVAILNNEAEPLMYKGEVVITSLRDEEMRELSASTQGLYTHYQAPYQAAEALYSDWSNLAREAFERESSIVRVDLYPVFLYLAVLLLLLNAFWGPLLKLRSRIAQKCSNLLISLLILSTLSLFSCQSPSLSLGDADEFTDLEQLIAAKDYTAARALLEDRAAQAANDEIAAILSINLAMLDIAQSRCVAALELLSSALSVEALNEAVQASAYYNMARALKCMARSDEERAAFFYSEAIKHLQKARDLGMAVNNEINQIFILQYPPCDDFQNEEDLVGNHIENAVELQITGKKTGTLCARSPIYYKISSLSAEELRVKLSLTPLERKIWLDQSSQLAYSEIALSLLDNDQTLATAELVEHDEQNGSMTLALKYDLSDYGSQRPLYLLLSAENYGEAKYSLELETTLKCSELDDAREPNDNFEEATPLFASQERLYICPQNPDYFSFTLAAGHSAWLRVATKNKELGLRFSMYDAQQKLMAVREPSNYAQFLSVTNNSPEARTYYLALSAAKKKDAGEYLLQFVSVPPCSQQRPDLLAQNKNARNPHILSVVDEQAEFSLPLPMYICPKEQDFYAVDPNALPKANFVEILSAPAPNSLPKLLVLRPDTPADAREASFKVLRQGIAAKLNKLPPQLQSLRAVVDKTNPQTLYRFSAQSPMFYLPSIIEAEKEDENDEEKDDQQENKKEDGESEQNKDESPAQKPEEPSDEQDSPKGPGTDTKGSDSTPDPHSQSEQNAAQLSNEALEKDRVNDLLDDIEEGDKNLPYLKFSRERSSSSDKNW